MNSAPASSAARRQSTRLSHQKAGRVARLMAPSSVENRSPICDGLSCHWLASCAATAGAVMRMVGVMAANSTMAASTARDDVGCGCSPVSAWLLSIMGVVMVGSSGKTLQNTWTRRSKASVPW